LKVHENLSTALIVKSYHAYWQVKVDRPPVILQVCAGYVGLVHQYLSYCCGI